MAAACNLTFCVVGRDARQLAAARALQNSGYTVLGAEGAGQADYILLPMPMDAEAADLARILRAARPGTLALGGRISEPVRKAAQAAGVELVDYFLRPELACLNAVPTAEGCLALLMQLRQRTIWESEFLVLGYGRIGRAVARRLQALGAAAGGAFGQHSAGVRVRGLTAGICSGLFCGGTGFPAACPFVGRSCCGRAGRLVGAARHAVHPCTGSGRRRSVGLCATLGCCYPVPAAHPCAASGRRQLSHRAKLLWRYGDAPGIHQKHCRYLKKLLQLFCRKVKCGKVLLPNYVTFSEKMLNQMFFH